MMTPDRPPLPRPIGSALEPVYRREIARRNRAYDRGKGVTRLDRPVISVGNLSVGGTGKTPMVRLLLRELLDAGHRPCVAMRGYKATRQQESDEAAAHRRAFPTVPVVAQPDRIAGLRELFATDIGGRVDCVVLDDGFQHRRLARDLDVVLIDASRDPFADRLLPAGWLREPVSSLARAGAVVLTHAELVDDARLDALAERARAIAPGAVIASARHEWADLAIAEEGRETGEPIDWLAGRRVVGVCAIGAPEGFRSSLVRACGREPEAFLALRDHDPYDPPTLARVLASAREPGVEALVTTDKDWSKLSGTPAGEWPCPVVRPRLEIRVGSARRELLARVLGVFDRS